MAVVLVVYGVGLQATSGVPSTGTLLLAPDPGFGALVSLVIAVFAGLGGWLWLDEPAWVETTEHAQRWSASAGGRQRRRALLLHGAGFALSMLLWFAVGPAHPVPLESFAVDAAEPLTCGTVGDSGALLTSMCRWDASRWAPVVAGALGGLLLAFGAFLSRTSNRDLKALQVDGVGLVFECETDRSSQRVAWSEVLGARLTRDGIAIDLRSGATRSVPLQGLSEYERGTLVFRINGQAALHLPERRVDLEREPRLHRILRSRE